MEDLFKKFVNAGVGFVSLTNDRVQKSIDALVKESKLSEQEGAKIMDDLKKNTDTKRKELEKQAQGLAARLLKTVGVAPNADVEELKRTVKGAKSSASAAAPAKKTPASKPAATAKTAAAGTASKAAGAVKTAAAKTSNAAGKTQKSAAGKAGAAKKEANGAAAAESNA